MLLGNFMLLFAQNNLTTALQTPQVQIGFEENKGQLADQNGNLLPQVLFKSLGTGPQIYVTTAGLTYIFASLESVSVCDLENDPANVRMNWSKLEMNLEGASIQKENVVTEQALPGYSNFYYAHCPLGILNVKSFHRVTIKNIYPGIDWVLNADNQNGVSHDFIVHPGADPSQINISYNGMQENISLNEKGILKISSSLGEIHEGGLNVYEQRSKKNIIANFSIDQNQMSFNLGNYDRNDFLVIDPPLQWTMPQSSTDVDYGYAVSAAHDGTGDVLVTGATDGLNFPTLNAFQGMLSGVEDLIVERINASGTRLWSTYYGGTNYEQGKGIASDNSGNCYVAGNTGSNNFPILNQIQTNYGFGVYDVAILKFNASGVRQFASWFGGSVNDNGSAIAVDATGNMYVTGYTNSVNFPVTGNAIQGTKNGSYDCFVMKISAAYIVQFATYYGGDDEDKARAIAIDAIGSDIFITGSTLSGTFPITGGVFQTNNANPYNFEDAFVLKMSSAQIVQWASYCGGNDADFGQGITVDNNNKIFITGYTLSTTYPVLNPGNGAYLDGLLGSAGMYDGFVTEISSNGTAKIWSTYLGGSGVDMGFAITFDPGIGIYVCGNTASTDFPLHQPIDLNYYQSVQGDGGSFNDMFIAWFDLNDSLRWSTYYGDASGNEAYGICVDALDNIFITGVDNNDIGLLKFNSSVGVGISIEQLSSEISLFPNPATERLFLKMNSWDEGVFRFEIATIQGRILYGEEKSIADLNGNVMALDVNELAMGSYFLNVYFPNGDHAVKYFIKE